jgi:hypothetical protein
MMMDALWRAAFLAANLWGASNAAGVVDVPDGGTVIMGGLPPYIIDSRIEYFPPTYLIESRTEYGPPILSRIPYVSRLFRTVGWSHTAMKVLPPIMVGEQCESQPPSEKEILRTLAELTRVEGFYEESRDGVSMTFEKLVDQVDPPRFFPLIGPAQFHHVNWKCTVNFTETIKLSFPVSFEVKRKCSEVVYIDKDHLHLHVGASEKDDAEAQEIRPLPTATKPAKCAAVPQVQLDIVVATINRSARPKLTYPWVDSPVIDPLAARKFMDNLRAEGVLKIVTQPSMLVLNGQTGTMAVGQDLEILTDTGLITQPLGARVEVTPKVMADGKIHLRLITEISALDAANDNPAGDRSLRVQHIETTAAMKPGQTHAISQVTQKERETEKRITLIDNNPFIGAFWMTIRKREGINEDTVILVTPHIVTPCCCEAEEQEQPDTRVVACWENRAGSMVGSVYLFSEETKRTIEAVGRLEVQAFDMAPALRGEEPRLLAQWTFDGEALKKLQRKDQIGVGYTLTAPWADLPANVENIKLTTVYVPGQGASRSDEPTYVARIKSESEARQAQQSDERPTKVVHALAVSNKSETRQMSLDDIIRLAKNGVSDKVIIGQIGPTESKFYLTVEDVVRLSKNGVSDFVIWVLVDNSEFDLTVDDLISLTRRGVSDTLIRYMQDRPKKR